MLPFSFASENRTLMGDGEVSNNENSYYFDASCENDNGDGSLQNPYKYLTADRIKTNSSIYLKEGEYNLNKPKDITNVTIYGSNNQNTTIRYSGVAFTASNNFKVENITLSGLTIKNYLNFDAKNVIFDSGKGYVTDGYNNCFGGAIYSTGNNSKVTIDNCTFKNTHAEYGGAIYQGGGNLLITNSEFINSYSLNFGGSIACLNTNNIRISKSRFVNSYSTGDAGGAIYIKSSVLNGDYLTFENCSSTFGSAISSLSSEVSLANIEASNNIAKYSGGAIYHLYGAFSVSDSKFVNNTALNGGALFIDNSKNCIITNNTFNDNNALLCGGAGYVLLCNLTENSNSFSQNHALQEENIYNSSSINMVIGSGNYTMVKVDSEQIDEIPSYFSLIDKHLVSPVADQQSGGNCWAFAPIAVLESCLLKATGDVVDLSEENMKNVIALYSDYGWKYSTNDGGNPYMALGYLTSWLGPILEKDDLYDDKSHLSHVLNSIYHVQNVMFLKRNSYTDNDAIKLALMKYGAVATTMCMGQINSKNAHYYSGNDPIDHAVTIVGWDDNFSRNNFYRTAPPGDGAWIVKNSWGDDWGKNGYFYVSYYDTKFAQPGVIDASFAIIFNDTIRLDKNYQYDISGITDFFMNSSSKVWYKNVFTATDNEYLASVSTYFDKISNWTVSINVNGQYKHHQSGVSNPGYYTMNLDKLIPLTKGDIFEVIFNISVSGEAYVPVSEEVRFNNMLYSPNISFVSYDGINWVDLYDCSWKYSSHYYDSQVAAIKAFTILNPINTTATIGYDLKGNLINISVKVLDQYGNSLKSGRVALNVDGKVFNVDVKNGYAKLEYIADKTTIHISAEFNAVGYNPSDDTISFDVPKFKLPLDVTVLRTLNNVSIEFSSLDYINMPLVATINNDVHQINLNNGKYSLKLNELPNGIYKMNVTILNSLLWELDYAGSFTIDIRNVKLITNNVVITDEDNILYNITIMDEKGNLLSNKRITITLNDEFDLISDDKGIVHVPVHLKAGNYTLRADFKGDNDYLKNSTSSNIYVKCKVDGNVNIDKYQDNANITVRFSKLINDVAKFLINGKSYSVNVKNGVGILNITNLKNGKYDVGISLDDNYIVNDIASSFTVNVGGTKIISGDVVGVDDESTCISARLVDSNSNPVKGQLISFNVANKVYSNYTGSDGFARVYLSLAAGQYAVNYLFAGSDNYFKSNFAGNIKIKSRVVLSLSKDVFQDSASLKLSVSKGINDVAKFVINGKAYSVNVKNGVAVLDLSGLANAKYGVDVSLVDANGRYAFNNVVSSFDVNVVATKVISSDIVSVDDGLTCVGVRLVDVNSNPVKGQLISFNVANKVYSNYTGSDGFARVYLNLAAGQYAANYLFDGSNNYFKSNSAGSIKVKSKVSLSFDSTVYQNSATLRFGTSKSIKDSLIVKINDNVTVVKVNDVISLKNLPNGIYNVVVSLVNPNDYVFDELKGSFKIDVAQTKIICDELSAVYSKNNLYSVVLKDIYANPVKNQPVEFVIGDKTYQKITDNNGKAQLSINLNCGDYPVVINYLGSNNYFKSTAKSAIHIRTSIIAEDSSIKAYNSKYSVKLLNTSKATFIINKVSYSAIIDKNGYASINILEKAGNYEVTIINDFTGEKITKTINVVSRITANKDITKYYLGSKTYQIRVLNDNGGVASGVYVKMNIAGKTYNVKTNSRGIASLKLKFNQGKYTITASYKGFKVSNKVVIKTNIITKSLSKKKSKTAKFNVKLLDGNGKLFKYKILTVKFKGKKYSIKTNSKGIASFTINKNLRLGKYNIVTSYGGLSVKNIIRVVK